jgi:hypothetical protein
LHLCNLPQSHTKDHNSLLTAHCPLRRSAPGYFPSDFSNTLRRPKSQTRAPLPTRNHIMMLAEEQLDDVGGVLLSHGGRKLRFLMMSDGRDVTLPPSFFFFVSLSALNGGVPVNGVLVHTAFGTQPFVSGACGCSPVFMSVTLWLLCTVIEVVFPSFVSMRETVDHTSFNVEHGCRSRSCSESQIGL